MIWRLDSFFNLPQTKRKETEDTKSKSPPQEEHEKEKKNPKPEEPQSSELDEEKVEHQTIFEPEETAQNTTFSSDDIKYAKVLGLEQPFESKDIKTTYRKIIAQYHPDRVIAMGPEIQEVAEKKAKEINEAYEHLRKSLNLP
jgi:DnaJ-domain-containing protein 1